MKIIDNAELGNKIRVLRENKKETQDDLKKVLNFNNRQQVSYIERGDRLPTLEQIGILAQHYNVTTDYLLGLSAVATNDADLKAVCDYTGLEKDTIQFFFENKNLKASDGSVHTTLNKSFIDFIELFINMERSMPSHCIGYETLREDTTAYIELLEETILDSKLKSEEDILLLKEKVEQINDTINSCKYVLSKYFSISLDQFSVSNSGNLKFTDLQNLENEFYKVIKSYE